VVYQVVQASKSGKYKPRLVYCPPFAITVLENVFGIPVLDHFVGNTNTSIIIGHSQMHLYNMNISEKDYFKASGDFSSYDQSIPSIIIKLSFEIIKSLYVFKNGYEEQLYDKMVNYVIAGHIFHPSIGTVLRKRGIASGSVFTNLIDSISNLLIINYVTTIIGFDYHKLLVCGDDNKIVSNKLLNVGTVSSLVKRIFNMNIDFPREGLVNKGSANSLFLGSYWSVDGPKRALFRMILSASKES